MRRVVLLLLVATNIVYEEGRAGASGGDDPNKG